MLACSSLMNYITNCFDYCDDDLFCLFLQAGVAIQTIDDFHHLRLIAKVSSKSNSQPGPVRPSGL